MSINQGPNTDMTIGFGTNSKTNDIDNTSPSYSLMSGKPIGTQQFEGLYSSPQHNGSQVVTVPGLHTATDISYSDDMKDENNLNFSDIGSSIYDAGKYVLEQTGLISKDKKTETKPTEIKPTENKPLETKPIEQSLSNKPKITDQNSKQIAALQQFFKSDIVRNFIGEIYNGNVDGVINSNVKNIASKIENKLEDIVNTDLVYGIVLYTTPDDIKLAIEKANEYQKTKKVAFILNKDDRLISLYNILKK